MKYEKLGNVLVINFWAWEGFLLQKFVAESSLYHARRLTKEGLERKIKDYEAILVQINLSDYSNFPFKGDLTLDDIFSLDKVVLNRGHSDIRKSSLHKMLESRGIVSAKAEVKGPSDELLIVKSNYNWGGLHEKNLPSPIQSALGFDTQEQHLLGYDSYYTKRREELPASLWEDESVVIEKYIANDQDMFFRFYMVGESILMVVAHDIGIIKKVRDNEQNFNLFFTWDELRKNSVGLPAELKDLLTKFFEGNNLDYCALDIVFSEQDGYFIIDLNPTPFGGLEELDNDIMHFLTLGLHRRALLKRNTGEL